MSGASSSSTDVKELGRLIHCAAYNVLIAVISSTQSELKFYVGFLFPSDNLAKVSVFVIHCMCAYYFFSAHKLTDGITDVVVSGQQL